MRTWFGWLAILLLGLAGCSEGATDGGDAGLADAFDGDTGTPDAGEPIVEDGDAETEDPGSEDAGNGDGDANGDGGDAEELVGHAYLVSQSYYVLGRELIGLPKTTDAGAAVVFLGWRSLPGDVDGVAFSVRRSAEFLEGDCGSYAQLTPQPLDENFFVDEVVGADIPQFYCVQPVLHGHPYGDPSNVVRVVPSASASPTAGRIHIPLGAGCPGVDRRVGHVVMGDLNGDQRTDFAFGYCNDDGETMSCQEKELFFGAALRNEVGDWEVAWCQPANIEEGDPAKNWPLLVWDMDQDGRAEVITRTDDFQHLSIYDGETGALVAQTDWPDQPYHMHTYRNYTSMGLLDGSTPLVIIEHYVDLGADYNAFGLEDGVLEEKYRYHGRFQGTHGLLIGDTDGDGRDEIVPASALIELNEDLGALTPRWINMNGHCDLGAVADFRPEIDGLEVFQAQENNPRLVCLLTQDGTVLWSHEQGSFFADFVEGNPTQNNSDFDTERFGGSVECAFTSGWERGPCTILDETTREILCATDDYCEGGCMSDCYCEQYEDCTAADRTAAGSISFGEGYLFRPDGSDASELLGSGSNFLDWMNGEGVAEKYITPPGTQWTPKSHNGPIRADVVGDSRAEFIDFGMDQFDIWTNINTSREVEPRLARRITPLAEPGYFKAVTRSGCGYQPNYNAVAYPTLALSCDRASYSEQDTELHCAISSISGFSQSVALRCEGGCDIAGLNVDVPAGGSVVFSVPVAPDGATPVRVIASTAGPILLTRSVIVSRRRETP